MMVKQCIVLYTTTMFRYKKNCIKYKPQTITFTKFTNNSKDFLKIYIQFSLSYFQSTPLSIQSINKQILAHVSEVCCYVSDLAGRNHVRENSQENIIGGVRCHLWQQCRLVYTGWLAIHFSQLDINVTQCDGMGILQVLHIKTTQRYLYIFVYIVHIVCIFIVLVKLKFIIADELNFLMDVFGNVET